ncbi:MAG: hypothetical protein J5623_08955 [Clostridiales bacterium]|nr:hypothetical protein [Clostridiales bacterium]
MKSRTAAKTVALALVLASSLTLFSGCGKKIYSDPNMTSTAVKVTTPGDVAYTELSVSLSKYDAELNNYMHQHKSECTTKEADDKTLGGIACHSVFTVSPDNKYRILQQEKKYDNKTVMDEYFDLGDALFIARTTVYKDGTFDPVEKYYIANNAVYKLDFNAQTVYKVVDLGSDTAAVTQKTLDLYFSFNDIMTKYG